MKTSVPFTLRPSTVEDAPLFYRLIDRTMRGFIVETWGGWDDARIRQESIVDSASPNAQVVQIGTMAAGVWVVARSPSHIQLEQIYLFPEYQRLGIGTALLKRLMEESDRTDVPVRLRVIAVNPAKRFYEGLGFVVTETKPEFFWMEYNGKGT
jgi:ribosomal protein S18 acetylase RimI-like enzyme